MCCFRRYRSRLPPGGMVVFTKIAFASSLYVIMTQPPMARRGASAAAGRSSSAGCPPRAWTLGGSCPWTARSGRWPAAGPATVRSATGSARWPLSSARPARTVRARPGSSAPLPFPTVNGVCLACFHGRAGHLSAQSVGVFFGPGGPALNSLAIEL